MTSQILTNSQLCVPDSTAQEAPDAKAVVDQHRLRLVEAMKSQYQLDQQVEFLHLQAETDSLLQQLQALKQQRQALATRSSVQ